ncbi:MAG: uracil-DNA glycosylase family protein [Bacteroidales bacterium]|nr:uracil-DNA glycosylase family protein [Bacteroidales bacterium]
MRAEDYKQTFDPEFESFCIKNSIHFYPWVGGNYHSCDKKILILGESYYLDDWNPAGRFDMDMTKDASPLAIRKYLGEEPTNDFKVETKEFITLHKATRAILGIVGRPVSLSERRSLWHNVVYSVFIQNSFRSKVADSSPFTKDEIDKDAQILDALLAQYKPDVVISFSNSIQNAIADNSKKIKFVSSSNGRMLTCITWKRSDIQFVGIPHPSILRSNISIENLHQIIKGLIN